MRLVLAIVGIVLALAVFTLLNSNRTRVPYPETPVPIPVSAMPPNGETTINGEMRVEGPCLFLLQRDRARGDPDVLPIWPVGFAAKGAADEGVLLTGPLGMAKDAVNSELLELHGAFVESAPPDAVVPPACVGFRLFHVARALNIAT